MQALEETNIERRVIRRQVICEYMCSVKSIIHIRNIRMVVVKSAVASLFRKTVTICCRCLCKCMHFRKGGIENHPMMIFHTCGIYIYIYIYIYEANDQGQCIKLYDILHNILTTIQYDIRFNSTHSEPFCWSSTGGSCYLEPKKPVVV